MKKFLGLLTLAITLIAIQAAYGDEAREIIATPNIWKPRVPCGSDSH